MVNLPLEATQAEANAIHEAFYAHCDRFVRQLESTHRNIAPIKLLKECGFAATWWGERAVDAGCGLEADVSEFNCAEGTPVPGSKVMP